MEFAEAIKMVASVISAALVIGGVILATIKWFQKQDKQTDDIDELRDKECEDIKTLTEQHNRDISDLKDELCVLSYAMLACLDGLKQQGCNGEVTKAHDMLEKHLNKKAHGK